MKRLAIAAVALALSAGAASADGQVQVGRLSCTVDAGIGLILGSSKKVNCTFHQKNGGTDTYTGEINKVGLDIGFTDTTLIEWLVFAATTDAYAGHALAGTYVGASGEATIGVGLGGNVLVGGLDNSFALQPFSVQAQTGLNLAVGLAGLTLR